MPFRSENPVNPRACLGSAMADEVPTDARPGQSARIVSSGDRIPAISGWILSLLIALVCSLTKPAQAATVEFDSPYQFHLLMGGEVLEIAGSFSWSVPQNLQLTLAAAPQVRIVSLNSPGGHVEPAMEVAEIIHRRGLATYVGRFCASACTLAFLGGTQRWLAPGARLGFHQAHAPGFSVEAADDVLRTAYQEFALPPAFVAHVLRTPPADLWFPKPAELRAAQITTGAPPRTLVALDSDLSWSLAEALPLVRTSSDRSVVQFAIAVSDVLATLRKADPEACWAFANQGTTDLEKLVPSRAIQVYSSAEQEMSEDISDPPPTVLDPATRNAAAADLTQSLHRERQDSVFAGLQPTSDHAAFCQSLYSLLQAALAMPEPRRIRALRVLLGPP